MDRVTHNLDGPDELCGTFTGVLECDNHDCGRQVIVAGDWASSWVFDDNAGREALVDFFTLRHISPPPQLLLTPERTPSKVVESIALASSVLWKSPDLAASQLRLAVEELLTARGVKRMTITSKHKRKRLAAQERLTIFAQTHPDIVQVLEAVKWIGNAGTHQRGLSVADVETGARFLELALRRLYDTTEAELLATAKGINRQRGLASG